LEVISALAGLWNIQNVDLGLIIEAKPSSGFDIQVSSHSGQLENNYRPRIANTSRRDTLHKADV
jgi:hypothetical protein